MSINRYFFPKLAWHDKERNSFLKRKLTVAHVYIKGEQNKQENKTQHSNVRITKQVFKCLLLLWTPGYVDR